MMKRSLLITAALAASLTAACTQDSANTAPAANSGTTAATPAAKRPEPPMPFPDVPRIALEEAKMHHDNGSAVFIDTHTPSVYAEEHIVGAINIPVSEGVPDMNKIPKGKKIIVYCS